MQPHLLWEPSEEFKEQSNLRKYCKWLLLKKGLFFSEYSTLWKWSVMQVPQFWKSIWEYFDIQHDGEFQKVLSGEEMPGAKWFEGTSLSYAEHIFRNATDQYPAIIAGAEGKNVRKISWNELRENTARVREILIQYGVQPGDTVAGYLSCIPEATIAFLASNSLGAIWSSCSPDFGTTAVLDRFSQIKPKVLFAVDHYQYNGKVFDKSEVINELAAGLPDVELIIVITKESAVAIDSAAKKRITWTEVSAHNGNATLQFTRVPFEHPIWVLYSSGTTGLPKAITHSTGGILLEQLKYGVFHNDFKPGERCFWYTTTGWMMWNYIHGCLLAGGTMVLYDGSPAYPDLEVLWNFAGKVNIAHFGTSAGFILANAKAGISPGSKYNLAGLRSLGSTGSTLPPEGFEWVYDHISKDIWLASMSGGTDVCSAFVGGNPWWNVWAGEIQCRALGCSLEAWDENGDPLIDEEGEMVITKPMPSMPVFFWNDAENARYRESYFEMYPGVWRHGDWIRITPREGVVIYGRSDATLNRGGIRIGTSEIYRAVDQVPEVKDSLIICVEKKDGEFWMPLFVVMNPPYTLTPEIARKVNTAIRNAYSPRHVPDEIIPINDIPYTISGKKTETPVKKIIMGKDPRIVSAAGSLRNPESLQAFLQYKITGSF
jgi:acetoacetyl-CoA synthetase